MFSTFASARETATLFAGAFISALLLFLALTHERSRNLLGLRCRLAHPSLM